jgi:hypothetical protein
LDHRRIERTTMNTVKECCGERCKFTTSFRSPVARVVLCGREITPEEVERAKEAFDRTQSEGGLE